MEQKKELTNQEKVNQILVGIEKNLKYKETEHSRTMDKFNGRIGDAVTFTGKIQGNKNFGIFSNPAAEISLSNHHAQDIADIRMQYAGFVKHLGDFCENSANANNIQIISAAWNKKNGVKTVLNKTRHGGLSVFHAQNETADALIDNLYNLVEQKEMTNWLKVAKILHEIKEAMGEKMLVEDDPRLDALELLGYAFGGRIGADITFSGMQIGKQGTRSVDLKCQDELLAHIRAADDFEVKSNTSVVIASPNWMGKDAQKEMYTEKEKGQECLILYNPTKETPAAVIEHIYQTIIHSKERAADVTKLSQLNLPDLKIRESLDQVMDLAWRGIERSRSQDAGREM